MALAAKACRHHQSYREGSSLSDNEIVLVWFRGIRDHNFVLNQSLKKKNKNGMICVQLSSNLCPIYLDLCPSKVEL